MDIKLKCIFCGEPIPYETGDDGVLLVEMQDCQVEQSWKARALEAEARLKALQEAVDKAVKKIYQLNISDASNLGGPMGTGYTTNIDTLLFSSLDKAKAHALKWYRKQYNDNKLTITWERNNKSLFVDTGAFIFRITPKAVK